MNTIEQELELIQEHLQHAEKCMKETAPNTMYTCGSALIKGVKLPIKRLIDNNIRNEAIATQCEKLIETIIKCGNTSFHNQATETIELSALLNYCYHLAEEFNLSKEVSDFLNTTYADWYSPEEQ